MYRTYATGHHPDCTQSQVVHVPTDDCSHQTVQTHTLWHGKPVHEFTTVIHHEDIIGNFIAHCKEAAEKSNQEQSEQQPGEAEAYSEPKTIVYFADGSELLIKHAEQDIYHQSPISFKDHGKVIKVEIYQSTHSMAFPSSSSAFS